MAGFTFLFVAPLYALWLAASPIALTARPSFAMAPAAVAPRAIIERHADNRTLTLEAVLDDAFAMRRSVFTLDGANGPRVFAPTNRCLCWHELPAGEYQIIATLRRVTNGQERLYRASVPFRAIGPDAPPPAF